MTQPVIVDLLPSLQIVIHPIEVQVIGRFNRDTGTLNYELTAIRTNVIIGEIEKIQAPDPVTFYIHENWQSFAIIAGMCSATGIKPRVLVMNWRNVEIDLYDFYHKGGDDLNDQGKYKYVSYTLTNTKMEAPNE